jgi:hypothetical protein
MEIRLIKSVLPEQPMPFHLSQEKIKSIPGKITCLSYPHFMPAATSIITMLNRQKAAPNTSPATPR